MLAVSLRFKHRSRYTQLQSSGFMVNKLWTKQQEGRTRKHMNVTRVFSLFFCLFVSCSCFLFFPFVCLFLVCFCFLLFVLFLVFVFSCLFVSYFSLFCFSFVYSFWFCFCICFVFVLPFRVVLLSFKRGSWRHKPLILDSGASHSILDEHRKKMILKKYEKKTRDLM